jgi:serine/threonine protein kinase
VDEFWRKRNYWKERNMFRLVYIYLIFYLDIIGKWIGNGSYGNVYEGIEKNTKTKVAIKVFFPNNDSKSMERDINSGLDERLRSEYTIIYEEVLKLGENLFAIMPLMINSLDKYLIKFTTSSKQKKFLSDEV